METAQSILSETRKTLPDAIKGGGNEHWGNHISFRNAFWPR